MVLAIEALDSVGMVDNWILGRADLRLRFSSGIYCAFPTHCGRMCAHSELMVMMAMVMMVMMAMVMMAMVMTAMVMVSVMVIIVPEALRQVGWLRQSFHRLRAFH
jgi:hypothetical protein